MKKVLNLRKLLISNRGRFSRASFSSNTEDGDGSSSHPVSPTPPLSPVSPTPSLSPLSPTPPLSPVSPSLSLRSPPISPVATPPLSLEEMRISQARGTREYWEEKRFWIEKDHEKDQFDKDDQFVKSTWTDDDIEDWAFGVEKDAQVEEWDLESKVSFWKQRNFEAFLSAKMARDNYGLK
ncbi:unnamed protein product [Arabidopsis lyrata]|uniref:Predicted protein n=1 Tax=Arabidopsis lyrata subsp. lyrata TaxID=81972 RepID=D7MVD4_ARALL|nr:predicted protein [Arabidopsis lyrata subsp. lyrata]CAH8276955.1 unnamed protein product [Arabidopsis lyrata]